ncbi:MAG: glycosyltransferase family 2 protein [Bacilli bacterium]|nr:glycosyltransferase family 2 protein [Bacilli bacterium]
MKLSAVIPCYNEEGNVKLLHDVFNKVFKGFGSYELIFVNDGSRDNTIVELKKLVKSSKTNIKVVDFSRNFGKEAAMYAGLKEASGEYVCIIDADLQQRPEVLLDMYNYLVEHDEYDSVCAFQDVRNEGKVLSFFKNTFYKLINKISDVNFVRGASDFRVFKRSVRDAIVSLGEKHRFTKGIFSYVGFNTYYMPYQAEERASGVSKWSFISLFKYAILGILSFSTLPLKIATALGCITLIGSFIYLIISLIIGVNATTMLMFFMIAFFGGIQLLAIGIFSQYMAMMYGEVKDRPIYIAREIISNSKK